MVMACRNREPYFKNSYIIFKNIPETRFLIKLIFIDTVISYIDFNKKPETLYLLNKPFNGFLLDWYRVFYLFLLIYLERCTYDFSIITEHAPHITVTIDKKMIETKINNIRCILIKMFNFSGISKIHEINYRNIQIINDNIEYPIIITYNNDKYFSLPPTKKLISPVSDIDQYSSF